MITLLAYLKTWSIYTAMRSSSGKVRREKTGRQQGGKGTERGMHFDALLWFSDWSRQWQTLRADFI